MSLKPTDRATALRAARPPAKRAADDRRTRRVRTPQGRTLPPAPRANEPAMPISITPKAPRARRALPGLRPARRAFSLIEMLIALAISSALLTSMMVALDTMFKGYQQTSGTVSTNVVARIAVNRILAMVRTGSDFGPFPADVLDSAENPLRADYFEYVSRRNSAGAPTEITRVEHRYPGHAALLRTWSPADEPPDLDFTPTGPGALWLVTINPASNARVETMLLPNVRSAHFTLNYNVGPKLNRATVDLVIESLESPDLELKAGQAPPTIRLVASAMPRRSIENP